MHFYTADTPHQTLVAQDAARTWRMHRTRESETRTALGAVTRSHGVATVQAGTVEDQDYPFHCPPGAVGDSLAP